MEKELKKGTDHIGVCVVYFCHDGNGRFLMGKRTNNARDEHGRWDIGGGAVEFGEDAEETLRKEIREEYGTDILASEFLGFCDVHREHEGVPTHWISLDFKVRIDPDRVRNGEPHKFDEVRWFTVPVLYTLHLPKTERSESCGSFASSRSKPYPKTKNSIRRFRIF